MRIKKSAKKPKKKLEYDGVTFRSNLEIFAYKALKEAKIKFEYEKTSYLLQEGFTFPNSTYQKVGKSGMKYAEKTSIRKITHTPDFKCANWVLETKGFLRQSNANIIKMFKYHILKNKLKLSYFMAHNQTQINECIKLIKNL